MFTSLKGFPGGSDGKKKKKKKKLPAMQEIQNVQSHGVHYSFMESIIFSFILCLCVCKLEKLIKLSSLLNILAKTFSKLILEQNFVNAICYLMWGKKIKIFTLIVVTFYWM